MVVYEQDPVARLRSILDEYDESDVEDLRSRLSTRCNITPAEYTRSKQTYAQRNGTRALVKKCAALRKEAYEQGLTEAESFLNDRYFRDFVLLYMTEGFSRSRDTVNLANSNPAIVRTFHDWLKKLTTKEAKYILRIHVDHDASKAAKFWAKYLGIKPDKIKVILKENTCSMKTRNWRNPYGILTVRCCDTYLRSRIEAYMNKVEGSWNKLRSGT